MALIGLYCFDFILIGLDGLLWLVSGLIWVDSCTCCAASVFLIVFQRGNGVCGSGGGGCLSCSHLCSLPLSREFVVGWKMAGCGLVTTSRFKRTPRAHDNDEEGTPAPAHVRMEEKPVA